MGDVDGTTLATLEHGDVWWTYVLYTYFEDGCLVSSLTPSRSAADGSIHIRGRFPPFVSELLGRSRNGGSD
jgi:hypothetical protein